MNTKTNKQNANNIMWVRYWIRQAHPSFEEYELYPEKCDQDRWICEIQLPLIDKTVSSISEKQVNAMLNTSKKAAKLIDEYMKEHKELNIKNEFKGKRWEIESDEDGKFLSIGMSSAWRREIGKKIMKTTEESIVTIKRAIQKIGKINGTTKNLFIQALDESLFENKKNVSEILEEVGSKIKEEYDTKECSTLFDKESGYVISFGYTNPPQKLTDDENYDETEGVLN